MAHQYMRGGTDGWGGDVGGAKSTTSAAIARHRERGSEKGRNCPTRVGTVTVTFGLPWTLRMRDP